MNALANALATNSLATNPSDETLDFGSLAVRFLISADDSNGSVAAFEVTVRAGERLMAPAHSHDHFEETVYGLEGVLTWTVGGQPIEIGPGTALCIPRGAVHRFDNFGGRDAKVLCVVSPAAIGPRYFREMLAETQAAKPPDRAKLVEIMRRHGLTPAPSPPPAG